MDNPIVNLAFHADLFLASCCHWYLINYLEFDKQFQKVLFKPTEAEHVKALEQLDKYIHDQAMILFTFQPYLFFAMKKDVMLPDIDVNGHVDYFVFSHTKKSC